MRTSIVHPRLLKKLGRTEDANAYYKKLIARNPDCYESYQAYFESIGLSFSEAKVSLFRGDAYFPADDLSSEDDAEKIRSELEVFATEFPRALVPQRILLTVTRGEQFECLIKKYIHRALKRNLPSLFVDLKPLYKDQDKRQVIQSIVEDYKTELEAAKGTDTDGEYLWIRIRQASQSRWQSPNPLRLMYGRCTISGFIIPQPETLCMQAKYWIRLCNTHRHCLNST
jgi:N-alpha-acetyltransferase 15/16, NatA auxiliary subunit